MTRKINILAISGSTRNNSSNHRLIKAIAVLASDYFLIHIFDGLADIPHFNPDLDNESSPKQAKDFRAKLKEADGIYLYA